MNAVPVTYTVVNRVIEVGKTGADWITWAGTGLTQQDSDNGALRTTATAAYVMPVKGPCDRCHGAKEAPNQAALSRIRLCEAAGGTVDPLAGRLRAAQATCGRSPRTSARIYQLAYEFIRKGGKRPVHARRIKRRAHLRPDR